MLVAGHGGDQPLIAARISYSEKHASEPVMTPEELAAAQRQYDE